MMYHVSVVYTVLLELVGILHALLLLPQVYCEAQPLLRGSVQKGTRARERPIYALHYFVTLILDSLHALKSKRHKQKQEDLGEGEVKQSQATENVTNGLLLFPPSDTRLSL